MSEPVIKCENVYKIFGVNAKKMLEEANGNVDASTLPLASSSIFLALTPKIL